MLRLTLSVRRKHIENGTHTGLETCLKNILNFLFFVVALYTRLPFFLLWLFAELCGAHFVVAFHCYCCGCLVLGFYFVFTLSTSLEFQFTLLLLFRAVTVPLSHAHKAVKWQREREREIQRARAAHTDTFIACERGRCEWVSAASASEWLIVHSLVALDS